MQPFKLNPKQPAAIDLMGRCKHSLLVGGGRSGKTFAFVRAMVIRALRFHEATQLIVRSKFNHVRASIWLQTLPAVMAKCFPGVKLTDHHQDGFVEFPGGAQLWFGGLDEKDRMDKILGREYCTILLNECSLISFAGAEMVRSRVAQKVPGLKNRVFYDLNPTGKGHWTYKEFIQLVSPKDGHKIDNSPIVNRHTGEVEYGAWSGYMFINPIDNIENIDAGQLEEYRRMSARSRARFLDGVYQDEIDGALWTLETLEKQRVEKAPPLRRVVVAVDPSGCAGPEDYRSDEIGIVVVGVGLDGNGYVLKDASGRYSPATWGRLAVEAYREFKADAIIGEKNFGGEMVADTIRHADQNVPVRLITASRGKVIRAEPIAALYETGKIFHVGNGFEVLEEQLQSFSTAGYLGDRSPDHADAMIHGVTELMQAPDSVFEFFRREAVSIEAARKAKEVAHAS